MPGPVSINGVSHISNCLLSFFPAAFHQIMCVICVIYYYIIFPSSICHHHGFHHLHLSLIYRFIKFPKLPATFLPFSRHFAHVIPLTKAGFSVVDTPSGGSRAPWDRLLLPCVGPEVWRQAVPDATQAVPRPSKFKKIGEQKWEFHGIHGMLMGFS
jgi:hypothetical protein